MNELSLKNAPLTASQKKLLDEVGDPEKTVTYNGRGRVFARDELLSAAKGQPVGMSYSEKTAEALLEMGLVAEVEQYGELTLQLPSSAVVIDLTM